MRDDGGGGTPIPEKDQNWTNTYKPVEVDTLDLRKFFTEMKMRLAPQAMTSTSGVLAPMGEMIGGALLGMGGKVDLSAGLFPEAVVVADLMTNTHAKFAAFFKDVGAGIQCIGDAAGVVAEIYHNGDAENSANINDVLFAFNDPLADRPKNLPKDATTDSFAAQQKAAAAASGQNAMALTAPDSAAKIIPLASGVTLYLYPDGSSKQITVNSDSNSWASGKTTTTEYYFNGKQVGSTTESQYNVRGGYQTMTTSTSPTSDPKAVGSSTTEVVTNPDGSQDITTTTIVDAHGNTSTHTVHVAPPPPKDTSGQGPIQTAENQYNSHGDKDYVQKHGAGY
jgi:hypothetical protein